MANVAWSGIESMPSMEDDHYLEWKLLLEQRTGMILPDERRFFFDDQFGYSDARSWFS